MDHARPDGLDDATVAAIGKASEALECVERARGHLYSMHQLIGSADAGFAEAAAMLDDAGRHDDAERMRCEIVGRNVLDGRWTFQVVEEFDLLYWEPVRSELGRLEATHTGGARHVYEAEMKERHRTRGRRGHESRPPDTYDGRLDSADRA